MIKQCLALIFIGLCQLVQAIDFSRVNVAWQYDLNAELRMTHRVAKSELGTFVFLNVVADSLQGWSYQFLIQEGYESENHQQIDPVKIDTLSKIENTLSLKMEFPVVSRDLLVIKATNATLTYYYDIGLKFGSLPFPQIYPIEKGGKVITASYLNRSGSRWAGSDSLFVLKYQEDFARAEPPMADMKPIAPSAIKVSSFSMSSDSSNFEMDYFYVVRNDSNASSGVTVLRIPPYFPEYRRLNELVASMLYLTSEAEEKALLKSKNLKKDFDSFWINNLNSKTRARSAIRKYYISVKHANTLFTDFRPGWKTDRGMMHIIYGKPDEVYRLNGLEEWYYDSGEAFEFNVISSFFAPRTYSLRRSKEYEEGWFQKIAKIRRGINE